VSRILLITQSTRSIGEFRRPLARRFYRRFADWHRRAVPRALTRLAGAGEVTVLAARDLVEKSVLPPGTAVRYYDEASFRVDSDRLAEASHHLATAWWPDPVQTPALAHRSVWLPEILTIGRSIVLRLEIAEALGAVEETIRTAQPDRVLLLTGASAPERIARLIAQRDGLPVSVAAPWSVWGRLYAGAHAALFPREERMRLRQFLSHPRRPVEAPPRTSAPRLLFVTCRPRHHLIVDPIIAAVRAAGAEALVVAVPNAEAEYQARLEALRTAGVPTSELTDHLPIGETRRLATRRRGPLRAVLRRLVRSAEFRERLTWKGLPLAEVSAPFLARSLSPALTAAALYQEAAFRALDAIAPDAVVITSNRRYPERALALAARARGIPCLVFSGTMMLTRDRTPLFDIGDRMLVMGEHLRERLVAEQGADPARIRVVGDPRSNAARLVSPLALRAEVYRDFGLAPERPLVVFISKYASLLFSAEEKAAYYRTMIEAMRRLPPIHVIVKVHPNEQLDLLREQVAGWGWPEAILTRDYDIHRLFGAADVAVMVTSQAGFEAMALDCPVVAVQQAGKDYEGGYMPPFVSAGVVCRVDMGDPSALAGALGRLLIDPGARAALIGRARAFAAPFLHPADGALGPRILAVVDEFAAARARGTPP
jgi:hypothetical protein